MSGNNNHHNEYEEATKLFMKLDKQLYQTIDDQYFEEPARFRSLVEVIKVLGNKASTQQKSDSSAAPLDELKNKNLAYNQLLKQHDLVKQVIEDVVKFQHGALNNTVDTMGDVITGYTRSREDVQAMRNSLYEIKTVLSTKRGTQADLHELWLKKQHFKNQLRILDNLAKLKEAPSMIEKLCSQKRFLSAVDTINNCQDLMFCEDLVNVQALVGLRDILLEQKGFLLEDIVAELKLLAIGDGLSDQSQSTTMNKKTEIGKKSTLHKDSTKHNSSVDDFTEFDFMNFNDEGIDYKDDNNSRFDDNDSNLYGPELLDETRSKLSTYSKSGVGPLKSTHHSTTIAVSSHGNRNSNSMWSLDLAVVNMDVEIRLTKPSESGSLYARLLVKAVGQLCTEDDVERMLLEDADQHFRKKIDTIRNKITDHNKGGAASGSGSTANVKSSKTFLLYAKEILSVSLRLLRKLIYLLKLLDVSRKSKESGVGGGSGGGGGGGGSTTSKTHRSGLSSDSLASLTSNTTYNNNNNNNRNNEVANSVLPGIRKKPLLALWKNIEEILITEFLRHFSDQGMTDSPNINDHKYHRSDYSHGSTRQIWTDNENENEVNNRSMTELTVCPCSAALVAPLYKDILQFSNQVATLLDEHVTVTVPVSAPVTVEENQKKKSSNLLWEINRFIETELLPAIQSQSNHQLQDAICSPRHFYAQQGQSFGFDSNITTTKFHHVDGSSTGNGNDYFDDTSITGMTTQGKKELQDQEHHYIKSLCFSAKSLSPLISPLASYWIHLPQHRIQVTTIIDRIFRGWISAAREEVQNVSNKYLSAQKKVQSVCWRQLTQDSIFIQYRSKMYHNNIWAQEALHHVNESRSHDNITNVNELDELSLWESYHLWDVSTLSNYPLQREQVCLDSTTLISLLVSVAYASDSLAAGLSKVCFQSHRRASHLASQSRKLATRGQGKNGRDINDVASQRGSIKSSRSILPPPPPLESPSQRNAIDEVGEDLHTMVKDVSKELNKLTEDCLAILRAELQVACFYYLHTLARPPSSLWKPTQVVTTTAFGSVTAIATATTQPPAIAMDTSSTSMSAVAHRYTNMFDTEYSHNNESDIALTSLHKLLLSHIECSLVSAPATLLATVLTPIIAIIPRLLVRCAIQLDKDVRQKVHSGPLGDTSAVTSHMLRLVVTSQQGLSMILQNCHLSLRNDHKLQDLLKYEYDRARRYLSLLSMYQPPSTTTTTTGFLIQPQQSQLHSSQNINDLKVLISKCFIAANQNDILRSTSMPIYNNSSSSRQHIPETLKIGEDYMKEELEYLWNIATSTTSPTNYSANASLKLPNKTITFQELWKSM